MSLTRYRDVARELRFQALEISGVLRRRRQNAAARGEGWASVLCFHRVNPDVRESGICIEPQRFRSILRLLKSEYDVLAFSQIVERIKQNRPFTGREVAITFDDGYLDNYEFAAPILDDLALPATFFLVAGYVGSSRTFWWDAQDGRASPMMAWSQARELAEAGFEIGAHTWSHPNLGTEPTSSGQVELVDAKSKLEEETGAVVRHFVFPYGGANDITEAWIDAIRAAGFESNSSAHGGIVTRASDPYMINRIGASPQRTLTEFRIDLDCAW